MRPNGIQSTQEKKAPGRRCAPGAFVKISAAELTTEIASAATAASAAATATTTIVAGITAGTVETSSPATAACWAILPGTGFVDGQCATVEVLSVKGLNRSLSLGVTAHRDEGKSA